MMQSLAAHQKRSPHTSPQLGKLWDYQLRIRKALCQEISFGRKRIRVFALRSEDKAIADGTGVRGEANG